MNISASDPEASQPRDDAAATGVPGPSDPSAGDVPGDGTPAPTPVSRADRVVWAAGAAADTLAVLALVWALWWLIDDDGGLRSIATAELGYLLLLGTPAAVVEARRQPRTTRLVLLGLALGWLVAFAFAVDRSGFVDSALVVGTAPLLFLLAARLHRRPWGPAALVAIATVAFSSWAWNALLKWWGFVQLGAQPRWDLVSWRNQSGILSGAFGLFLLGPTLVGRRTLPLIAGGLAALGVAGAWLSSSRGAIVFTALGMLMSVGVACWWRWNSSGRDWWAPLARAAAVGLAAAAIVAGLLSTLPAGTESPVSSRSETVSGNAIQRGEHWRTAARMGLSRPLVGLGPGSYQSSMPLFNAPEGRLTAAAHNEWLEAWSDGGLALALPAWTLAAAGAVLVWRRTRGTQLDESQPSDPSWSQSHGVRQGAVLGAIGVVVTIGGHAAIDFDFHYPVIAALFAVGIGALSADRTAPTGPPPHVPRDRPSELLADRQLAVAAAAVLAVAGVLGLGIWGATGEANARSDELDTATLDEIAAAQAPWDTPALLYVSGLQHTQGDLEGAIQTLQSAVDWNPLDPRPALAQARLRYQLGQISDVDLVDQLEDPPTRLREWALTAELLLLGNSLELADRVAAVTTEFHPTYARWGISETVGLAWRVRLGVALARDDCDLARRHLADAEASGFDIREMGIVDELRAFVAPHCALQEPSQA